jgi:hypothetical protein
VIADLFSQAHQKLEQILAVKTAKLAKNSESRHNQNSFLNEIHDTLEFESSAETAGDILQTKMRLSPTLDRTGTPD